MVDAFPSTLSCSGRNLVDASGNIMPQMYGFCVEPFTKFVAQDFLDMYSQGARLIRMVVDWGKLEPTQGNIDTTFVATLDDCITWAVEAGMYIYINFAASASGNWPGWANVAAPDYSLQNYLGYADNNATNGGWGSSLGVSGENATTYLAQRYGPDSSFWTGSISGKASAIIGIGINEPVADYDNQDNWLIPLITEQAQCAYWARQYAPGWIQGFACAGASSAPVPNAKGSGQTTQTFTAFPSVPTTMDGNTVDNWFLEVHDNVRCFTDPAATPPYYGISAPDGRNTTYGFSAANLISTDDASYDGYPPIPLGGGSVVAARAVCQSNMAIRLACDVVFTETYNAPIYVSEANFNAANMTFGADIYALDKLAALATMSPIAITVWEYDYNQGGYDGTTPNPFSVRPGPAGPASNFGVTTAIAADPDGWLTYTNILLGQHGFRGIDVNGVHYRLIA
jgi:hypothetical protein